MLVADFYGEIDRQKTDNQVELRKHPVFLYDPRRDHLICV